MRTRQDLINTIRAHQKELRERFGISSMQMFGSVARNEHKAGSDVDLFVSMPSHFYNYIAATQYLRDLLGSDVDLIQDRKGIRPFFRQQIERDAINIFPTTANS